MSSPVLTSRQRQRLRALAHHLKPIVFVGQAGLSDGIVLAIERALLDHELIKVKMHQPDDRDALAQELAAASGAMLCGLVGHTAILYRPHPENPRLTLE
jgi:RNA-binding protein